MDLIAATLSKRRILLVLTLNFLLAACGPVVLPLPTRKPPQPYYDVARLNPDTFLMGAPSLNASGQYLAFGTTPDAGVGPTDLAVADLDERKLIHQVYTGGAAATAISPDGEDVVVDNGFWQLSMFETGHITPTDVITGSAPAWSPDGQSLAYASAPQQENEEWWIRVNLLDLASGRERVVFERKTSRVYVGALAWSPDGRLLAFNLNYPSLEPLDVDSLTATLFLLDIESERVMDVAQNWEVRSLQFSPDSSKLLFLGAPLPLPRSPRYQLYILDTLGSCHKVPPPFANTVELALSADGNTIAVSISNPDWLLVAPTTEALPDDFWDSGESCPRTSE